ncbi:hypothetical protein BpHYR1_042972 [Brachionus plicatilis]|uniref:Uncharacterized protein n=1 Tax=Brachionus plicatilis TaxID=10195 RepID=A0A3M7P5U1_BRAPC|nr:hypothetical protein BpHYR1_042972 [Brachionus plicatilis]
MACWELTNSSINLKEVEQKMRENDVYDKYNTTRPMPSRKLYKEMDRSYAANNTLSRYRSQDYNDYNTRPGYRNQSAGRRNLTQYNY